MQAEYYAHRQQKNICNLFAKSPKNLQRFIIFLLKTPNYWKL